MASYSMHLRKKSSFRKPPTTRNCQETARHGLYHWEDSLGRKLVLWDIPKLYVLANLSLGEGGTSSTLETVTPKAGAGSDVTVANTATPPVIKERLNDLDEEDPCATAPITVAGSMVAAEGVSGIHYTRSHQRLCTVSQHSCCPGVHGYVSYPMPSVQQ